MFPCNVGIWLHFKKEKDDETRTTFDYGVMADFDQESHASSGDTNLIHQKLKYVGKF